MKAVNLRPYAPGDTEALADVLRDSIRGLGSPAYSSGQVDAWASYPEDMDDFRTLLSGGVTLVAEDGGDVLAFGQLHPADHVEFLYCRAAHVRKGIASELYRRLEAIAIAAGVGMMRTEASRVSRAFFEKFGYRVQEIELVQRCGETLERFRMTKRMNEGG